MKRSLILLSSYILIFSLGYYFLYSRKTETFNAKVPVPVAPQIDKSPVKHVRLHSGRPIIEGGVHNLSQLEMAIRNPDIAESFIGIDLSLMHPVVLDHNVVAWVNYLVPNIGIYWVMNPVLLKKGEIVWTDGTNYIRGLCGNRVAFAPGLKVAPEFEEFSTTLETPVSPIYTINQTSPPVTPLTPTTPYSPSAPPIYTPFPPRSPGTPTSGADNPMPTVLISAISISLLAVLRKFLRSR